ncbi:MAG: DUF6265 family protein [Planctomycetota bacterium]
MQSPTWSATALALLTTLGAGSAAVALGPRSTPIDEELRELDGEWLYVEDVTDGRAAEDQGPPMSPRLRLRVDEDALVWVRTDHEERMHFDGSTVEVTEGDKIKRYTGTWQDGLFEYETETVNASDGARLLLMRKAFELTPDGMLVHVAVNPPGGYESSALYLHPDDIELPKPAKATIDDMEWLAGAWVGAGKSTSEERWSPPSGGAMLAVARTVRGGRMVAFEYLRIVERKGGLVYVAQPGGGSPTEFVLTELSGTRAVFENPRHDSPQRIVYELAGDRLTASIGFMKGGRPTQFGFQREDG